MPFSKILIGMIYKIKRWNLLLKIWLLNIQWPSNLIKLKFLVKAQQKDSITWKGGLIKEKKKEEDDNLN
jgi:hypothetical protein